MLLLFETPAGFAVFKVLDEGKLSNVEVITISTFSSFFSFLLYRLCLSKTIRVL